MITFTQAPKEETEKISQLLKKNNLPVSDLRESAIVFFVAKKDRTLIGCIGLEKYGKDGLLRSFAVDNEYWNLGIGKEMYNRLLKYSQKNGIKTLHLLTNTAKDYFLKTGFSVTHRDNAPVEISKSREFEGLCPVTSTYMILDILS
jgi:amino-acid N-acetyltransferase